MTNKEVIVSEGKLNEVIVHTSVRPNGTLRIQQDWTFCPSLAEQHTAHLTDLNYLISKYKPDELAAYMAARNQYRQEILGHDFSTEPSLQDAKNAAYHARQQYESLDEDLKRQFLNPVEFFKFIDNPANQEKMIKLGLLTKKEISKMTTDSTTTTQEEATVRESKT